MYTVSIKSEILRGVACLTLIALASQGAFAQDPQQQVDPRQTPAVAALSAAGSIPPGYYQTNPQPWPRSGWISSAGLRPLPPGYTPDENGEIVFKKQLFPGCQPGWWRPGCMIQNAGVLCHERSSFHMYIRGYGPAIHTRPASIWW